MWKLFGVSARNYAKGVVGIYKKRMLNTPIVGAHKITKNTEKSQYCGSYAKGFLGLFSKSPKLNWKDLSKVSQNAYHRLSDGIFPKSIDPTHVHGTKWQLWLVYS